MNTIAQPSGALRRGGRSENRLLLSSSTALILGRLTTAVFGWAGSVVIARTLTGDDWGRYSFVFALLGIMNVVTDLGVGRVVLSRLGSGRPEEESEIAGSFIALRALLGGIGYLLALGYVVISGLSPPVMAAAALAGTTIVLATPANAFFVLYQSRLRLTYVAVWDIIGQAAQFALTVLVAVMHPTLLAFIVPAVIRAVIVFTARGVWLPSLFEPGFRPSFRAATSYWGEMLKEAVPISLGLGLLIMASRIDMMMLEKLDTYEAVGLYAIGYKFSDLLALVVGTLAVPFTTVLIASWPDKPDKFRERLFQAVAVAAMLGGLAVVVFWPSSRALITLLYGPQFAGAATSAALLVTSSALAGLTFVVTSALIAARKLRIFPWLAAVGLLLNVGLNLVLIPLWSIDGAAVATLITELTMILTMLLLLQESLGVPGIAPWGLLVRQSLIAAAVATPATLLVLETGVAWILVAVVSAVVHLLISALAEGRESAAIIDHARSFLGRRPAD